jgi:hypothetical protein
MYFQTTMVNESYDVNRYQGRVLSGTTTGWFNLNASSAPTRSIGWHKFEIERLSDGSTINFFVDGAFGRQITGATADAWDTVVIGSTGSANA